MSSKQTAYKLNKHLCGDDGQPYLDLKTRNMYEQRGVLDLYTIWLQTTTSSIAGELKDNVNVFLNDTSHCIMLMLLTQECKPMNIESAAIHI